jgi:hypothetical protein
VEIVKVNVDSSGWVPSHECDALGGQTIGTRCIRASIPLDASVINPIIVGDSIQTTSNSSPARCGCPVNMVVGCIDVGMIIEILIGSVNSSFPNNAVMRLSN